MSASLVSAPFGRVADSTPVDIFTLTNTHGLVARVMTYGATLVDMLVPDREGRLADVHLGLEKLEDYLRGHPYLGSTVGRFANRIAKGRFVLDGREYALAINNGPNSLHGGVVGFDKKVWKAEPLPGAAVKFSCISPDGEEGFPGTLHVSVTCTLTDANELRLDYVATTDRSTVLNLTNHAYWNLAGAGAGDVLGHILQIAAERYTPKDDTSVPTGEIALVMSTPLDFRQPRPIGRDLPQRPGEPAGYDHNFVLDNGGGAAPGFAARAEEPGSGRVLELFTTEPGVQLYTANYFDGSLRGKAGAIYRQHAGFCLETQHYPDSVNKPHFPPTVLRPGQTFRSTTVHRFSAK